MGTKRKKGKQGSLLIGGDREAGSQGMSRASETEVSIMESEVHKQEEKSKRMSRKGSGAAGTSGARRYRTNEAE